MAEVFIDNTPLMMMAMREALVLARIIRDVTAIEVQPFRGEGNGAVFLKMQARRITCESTCEKVKHRAERHA